MTTTVETTPEVAAPVLPIDWDSLLSAASLEEKVVRTTRVKVEVPASVLLAVEKARKLNKRIVIPVRDAAHLKELSDVFYSAGDLLEPKASVIVVPVGADGKKTVGNAITHVRVTVGERRGQKIEPKADVQQ